MVRTVCVDTSGMRRTKNFGNAGSRATRSNRTSRIAGGSASREMLAARNAVRACSHIPTARDASWPVGQSFLSARRTVSNIEGSRRRATSMEALPVSPTKVGWYPIRRTRSRVGVPANVRENLPRASESVRPKVLSAAESAKTTAPATGARDASSRTMPRICCAAAVDPRRASAATATENDMRPWVGRTAT